MERPLPSRTALAPAPSFLGDPLAPIAPLRGTIEVDSGMDREHLPLAGLTVGEVRRRLAGRFGLHPEAVPLVGGRQVRDDVVVRSGERLSFVHQSGEKGLARRARATPRVAGARP